MLGPPGVASDDRTRSAGARSERSAAAGSSRCAQHRACARQPRSSASSRRSSCSPSSHGSSARAPWATSCSPWPWLRSSGRSPVSAWTAWLLRDMAREREPAIDRLFWNMVAFKFCAGVAGVAFVGAGGLACSAIPDRSSSWWPSSGCRFIVVLIGSSAQTVFQAYERMEYYFYSAVPNKILAALFGIVAPGRGRAESWPWRSAISRPRCLAWCLAMLILGWPLRPAPGRLRPGAVAGAGPNERAVRTPGGAGSDHLPHRHRAAVPVHHQRDRGRVRRGLPRPGGHALPGLVGGHLGAAHVLLPPAGQTTRRWRGCSRARSSSS